MNCERCGKRIRSAHLIDGDDEWLLVCAPCKRENDKMTCPECGQPRPNDERVKNGMKCGICAGYGEGAGK